MIWSCIATASASRRFAGGAQGRNKVQGHGATLQAEQVRSEASQRGKVMVKKRSTEQSLFPPLEYLKVVGYFRSDLVEPMMLIRRITQALANTLRGRFHFDQNVRAMYCFKNPSSEHRARWRLQPDLGWYYFEPESAEVPLSLEGPSPLSGATGFVNASLGCEGRRSATYRVFDSIWKIRLEASESFETVQSDCMCLVSLATRLFPSDHTGLPEQRDSTRVTDEITRCFLESGDLYYALADACYFRDDSAGWCYQSGGPSDGSSVRFRIEHELWEQARESRRERVRGVYPAQFLSPVHLGKLGGKERFIASLLELRNRREDLITDFGERGMMLRLTPTPIDASAYGLDQGFSDIATWVFRRFRDAGLFL